MRFEKQQLGIVIAFIALIAVFAILQYRPLRSQAHAMEQVSAAQLTAVEKTDDHIKNLPTLHKQLDQMQANIQTFNKRIPDERMLGAFLKEIADVMNGHKLTEQVVQPDTETQIGNFTCIPVRMQCKGTVRQIFDFFTSLQTLDRLMKIEQVQLKNDQDLSGMLTMIAIGNIYYKTTGGAATGFANYK